MYQSLVFPRPSTIYKQGAVSRSEEVWHNLLFTSTHPPLLPLPPTFPHPPSLDRGRWNRWTECLAQETQGLHPAQEATSVPGLRGASASEAALLMQWLPSCSGQREGVPEAQLIFISKWDRLCFCQDLLAGLSPAPARTVPILSKDSREEKGKREGFLREEAGNILRSDFFIFIREGAFKILQGRLVKIVQWEEPCLNPDSGNCQ